MTHEEAKINAAQAIAELVLLDRLDKQGKPIIEHCRRVYERCRLLTQEQKLAAILHDCIEDGEGSIDSQTIHTLFGWTTADIVDALTRKPGEPYTKYIRRVIKYPPAILVKLADIGDNIDPARGITEELERLKNQRYLPAMVELEEAARYLQIGTLDQPTI